MRLQDLNEEVSNIGLVLSNSNGKFYDLDVVDYKTLKPVTGHTANLGNALVRTLREHDLFEKIEPFVKKHFKGKKLGEDYSSEDANFTLYGPMTSQQLGEIEDKLVEEFEVE